jgi:8-oxo-dGTP diphosphatase
LGPIVAVGAVVIVDPQRFVLIRRKNPPGAGTWTLPGGRVLEGEALSAALIREVREETGLEVEVGALVEVVELLGDDYHFIVLDYVARVTSGTLQSGDDASDAVVVHVDALADYGVTPLVDRVVRKALAA